MQVELSELLFVKGLTEQFSIIIKYNQLFYKFIKQQFFFLNLQWMENGLNLPVRYTRNKTAIHEP